MNTAANPTSERRIEIFGRPFCPCCIKNAESVLYMAGIIRPLDNAAKRLNLDPSKGALFIRKMPYNATENPEGTFVQAVLTFEIHDLSELDNLTTYQSEKENLAIKNRTPSIRALYRESEPETYDGMRVSYMGNLSVFNYGEGQPVTLSRIEKDLCAALSMFNAEICNIWGVNELRNDIKNLSA